MPVHEPKVLLVGHSRDEHCDYVGELLQQRGRVAVARTSREDLPEAPFVWRPEGHLQIHEVQLDGYNAGWWRRPGHPRHEVYAPDYTDFVMDEARDAFDGAVLSACTRWLTHPSDLERAELKLVQMKAAQKHGVPMPATLVTNSREEATLFVKEQEASVVKPVRYGLVASTPTPFVAFTSLVRSADLKELSGVPVVFQAAVQASRHLRVVTVGLDVFISELESAELDWREKLANHDRFIAVGDLAYPNVATLARVLTRELHLGLSSQDWILGQDGHTYFLEMNPSGQWLFLEEGHEGRIGLALAQQLERLAIGDVDGLVS